jgi:hypothetical protein
LIQEAQQGTLATGTIYLDEQGETCTAAQAAFAVQQTELPLAASLARLTLQITPVGAPDRTRTYAVVLQTPQ